MDRILQTPLTATQILCVQLWMRWIVQNTWVLPPMMMAVTTAQRIRAFRGVHSVSALRGIHTATNRSALTTDVPASAGNEERDFEVQRRKGVIC